MKAAVLGLGKVGHAMAALLTARGCDVAGFTRSAERARDINEHGISVSGALEGNFRISAYTDIADAVKGRKLLLVTTLSKGHKPMAERLRGLLEPDQLIVIMTGNWGAYEFYCVLGKEAAEKNVAICETSGNLSGIPKLDRPASILMKPIKRSMSLASVPPSAAPAATEELKDAFPEFYAVKNILDTSMNSTNPAVHVPVALFNITRMANGEDAAFYKDGLPEILLNLLEGADEERCAVARAVGGSPSTILELMNKAWNTDYKDLRSLALNNASLSKVMLPKTPYHRFLTEDVPFGFMPVSRLGKIYGVPTPRIDMMIDAYKYLLAEEAEMNGPEFAAKLDEVLKN